jgi:WD40 repeat protein
MIQARRFVRGRKRKRKLKSGCVSTKRTKTSNETKDTYYPYHLALVHSDCSIGIYKNDKLVHRLEGHTDMVEQLIQMDPSTLVSISLDNTMRIWNILNGKSEVVNIFDVPGKIFKLSDHRLIMKTRLREQPPVIRIWNIRDKSFEQITMSTDFTSGPIIKIENISVLTLDEKHVIAKIGNYINVYELVDGQFMIQPTEEREDTITVCNIRTRTCRQFRKFHRFVRHLFLSNGQLVIWCKANANNSLHVLSIGDDSNPILLKGHGNSIMDCIEVDEHHIASCSIHVIRVWDLRNQSSVVLEMYMYCKDIVERTNLMRLHDGKIISFGNRVAQIWDPYTGESQILGREIGTVVQSVPIMHIVELLDGRLITQDHHNGILRVWNRENGSSTEWHAMSMIQICTKSDYEWWIKTLCTRFSFFPKELWEIVNSYCL